jgi:hypothetical protein
MKKLSLVVGLVMLFGGTASAQQFRFLTHGTVPLGETNWGLAGWTVTNLAEQSNQVFLGGLRYQNDRFWIEFLACGVANGSEFKLCFDTRTNVNLSDRINVWFETQTFTDTFYWFAESDYTRDQWLVGVETENIHAANLNSYGIGPHVKFRLSRGIWTGPAYQFRPGERNTARWYLVFHFP